MFRSVQLNSEQQKAIDTALSGLNLCLLGKAGTGKTTVARKLISSLEETRNVQVTGLTGKACTIYLRAKTLHSFAGREGRKTYQEIRSKIENSAVCMKRISETEVPD